ncbi:hypothetical protein G9A89_011863 [Geosiphon pyriformis]|nr:hypothetical protein G9A89_011863 [Geosiphon pyriformis]
MYLKSTHSQLIGGGHQWEVTLFCNTEANTIKYVDITPKSRGSRVVPNEAKPAPTAYTMTYTTSTTDNAPHRFTAVITFLKGNEKKTVSVPAHMATDRKRRKAEEDEEEPVMVEKEEEEEEEEKKEEKDQRPIPPPKDFVYKRRDRKYFGRLFKCFGKKSKSKNNQKNNFEKSVKYGNSSSDANVKKMKKGCCVPCSIM